MPREPSVFSIDSASPVRFSARIAPAQPERRGCTFDACQRSGDRSYVSKKESEAPSSQECPTFVSANRNLTIELFARRARFAGRFKSGSQAAGCRPTRRQTI